MTRKAGAEGDRDRGDLAFWSCAGFAMALHTLLLLRAPGLQGGADLLPHLRLMQLMGESPALRSVYAPTYHVIGALLAPLVGLELAPRVFALLAAAAWIAGFRCLQRAAGLPPFCAALFALFPYGIGFSWCLPKVEALGYGLVFVGLAMLVRRRHAGAAALLAATFFVHTASAMLLGLAGGVLCLASRDVRGLAALAVGTLAGAALPVAHLAAGCSLPEALRLTGVDYLIASRRSGLAIWEVALALAGPIGLALAALGAPALWRTRRPLAVLCGTLTFVYLNEIWLAPFGRRVSLDLLRGLSVLALPVAIAGGLALAARPRLAPWLLAACALWAAGAALWTVPRACHVRPIAIEELRDLQVSRCTFTWRGPAIRRPSGYAPDS